MSRLFANGTEGEAWMNVWCHACANEDTCDTLDSLFFDPHNVPAAITPEPRGTFHLPALHLCSEYTPPKSGDPYAEERAKVIEFVNAWEAP